MQKPKQLPSGKYRAEFSYRGKRYSAGSHTTERKAETAARVALTAMEKEESSRRLGRDAGTMTFSEYATKVLDRRAAEQSLVPRTLANYEGMLRLHIHPTFGSMPLKEIRKRHVRDWWAGMPVVPMRKYAYRLIGMILTSAVDDDEIEFSPASRAVPGAAKDLSKPRPYLDPEAFAALHAVLDDDMKAFTLVLLGGSLRLSEGIALNRKDLDLSTGILTVDKQLSRGATGGPLLAAPKNGGKRKVRVPPETVDAMTAYFRSRPIIGFPAPMFTNRQGLRMSRADIYRRWHRARAEVGLDDVHLHDLRHSSLTIFGQNGASLAELMARAGHRDQRTAMRYQHADAERDVMLVGRFSAAMFPAASKLVEER